MNLFATLPLLAQGDDWGNGWWPIWPLLWAVAIGAVAWFVVRRRRNRPDPLDGARAIVAERYARGDLSAEEYRERLDELQRATR